MKTLPSIICFAFLACCSQAPRPLVVDTDGVVETTEKVSKSSEKVSGAIVKVEESNDKSITKLQELQRQMVRVRELAKANAEIQDALDNQERLAAELGDELARGRIEIRNLKAAKALADADILTLQKEVSKLVKNANDVAEATEKVVKEAAKVPELKEKLNWWRWAAALTWIAVALTLIIRFFGAAILTAIKVALKLK